MLTVCPFCRALISELKTASRRPGSRLEYSLLRTGRIPLKQPSSRNGLAPDGHPPPSPLRRAVSGSCLLSAGGPASDCPSCPLETNRPAVTHREAQPSSVTHESPPNLLRCAPQASSLFEITVNGLATLAETAGILSTWQASTMEN